MSNPNLGAGQVLPGFYSFIDFNLEGGGESPNNRCLIIGYKTAAGFRTPNKPFLPAGQDDVDAGCGEPSDLARMYAAALAQPEAQDAEVWCLPIAEPTGTNAVYELTVRGTPTKAGTLRLWISSKEIPAVGFSKDDTPEAIASAIAEAISSVTDLPFSDVSTDGAKVLLTYIHPGWTGGYSMRMRANVSPDNCGMALAIGAATFAETMYGASGAGSVLVSVGDFTVTVTLTGDETEAEVAAKVITAINSDDYPVRAVIDDEDDAVVWLIANNDEDFETPYAVIANTTGLTVDLGSGATDGTGSLSSYTLAGTEPSGAPNLTAALANLRAMDPFRSWVHPWRAADAAVFSAIASHIEDMSDGSITGQKQQVVTAAFGNAASAFNTASGSTPSMTTSAPHYANCVIPYFTAQPMLFAARVAVARAGLWYGSPQKNWNEFQLKSSEKSPLLGTKRSASPPALNQIIRSYACAPIAIGRSGNWEIVKGRTTSTATDKRLWSWSAEAQAAYHAVSVKSFMRARFAGGSILRYSEPKAPGVFDNQSFKSAMQELLHIWEGQGNYDGADAFQDSVKVIPYPGNPNRLTIGYPESPVIDLDQLLIVNRFASASQ